MKQQRNLPHQSTEQWENGFYLKNLRHAFGGGSNVNVEKARENIFTSDPRFELKVQTFEHLQAKF